MNMKDIFFIFLCLAISMSFVSVVYRIIDKNARITRKLVARFPIIKEKKFLIQTFGTLIIVLIVGMLGILFNVPTEICLVIFGGICGFINGVMVSITVNEI